MNIGKNIETGKDVNVDLATYIDTRSVITASSGGGKSWAVRKFMQESYGKAQQLILDWEGEYSNLRTEYDYLLVGKGGDVPISIRTAEILAKKLMEIKVSTIIDLSDMPRYERITFVKRFIDSLLNLPKELYDHLVMIFIDEAHQLCPQKGNAESMSSINDIMSLGRKRGIGTTLCTQRIAKLNKDAVAEARNGGYGGMGLLEDRKRACEELGFNTRDLEQSIKNLESGEFYMFGSAISKEVIKVKIGDIKVKPPKVGQSGLNAPSPTPKNIKKILREIIDLPKEAENEMKTKQDLTDKIRKLNGELSNLRMQQGKPKIDEKSLKTAEERGYERGNKETELKWQNSIAPLANDVTLLRKKLNKLIEDANIMSGSKVFNIISELKDKIDKCNKSIRTTTKGEANVEQLQERGTNALYQRNKNTTGAVADAGSNPALATYSQDDIKIGRCERMIYSFLYSYSNRTFSKEQVGSVTGYSCNSGGFNNSLGRLNALGLIKRVNGRLQVNKIDPSIVEQGFDFSINNINNVLGKCEKEIFQVLKDNPGTEYTKEDLASQTPTNYSPNSGGFNNSLGRLNTLGLIERNNSLIRLNQELMEI